MSHHHPEKKEPARAADAPLKGGDATESPATANGAERSEKEHSDKKEEPGAESQKGAAPPAGELRAELDQAKDRVLRCQAELDNYRKRAARELDEHRRYADIGLMRDLLPVLDNIQRAIEAAEKSADGSGLLDGVKLVAQQLQDVLKHRHCEKIPALGLPFDPHLHHAILQQPSGEHPANTVIMVTQDGYKLHDRVVRPSQVIVSVSDETKDDDA